MTQDGGDRIDRIEAALDRQVAVNADLRTSVAELKASTAELTSTANALLQVVSIHQQNFERLTAELNADRQRAERDRQDWQLQIERIWQHLQQRGNG